MKSEKNNKNNIKDYVIVFAMFITTFLVVFGLRGWYRNYKEYQLTIPVISGQVQEISVVEFNNYVIEHDAFFMYIGVAEDENCRELEQVLPKVLSDRNIKDETVYLNLTDIANRNEKIKEILSSYNLSKYEITYPAFLIIKDKKIVDVVTRNDSHLTIGDIEKILDIYEIGV